MKQILIIEDDIIVAKKLSDALTKQGYHINMAHTGAEGIAKYRQIKCDLIVLDLSLPEEEGIKVLEEIRMMTTVPVIVLTDKYGKDSVASLLFAGANDYLTKPFYLNELLPRIEVQLNMRKQKRKKI